MIGICGLHDRLVCKAKQVWEGQTGTHRNKPWIRSSNIKYIQIYYCPCFHHESVFKKETFTVFTWILVIHIHILTIILTILKQWRCRPLVALRCPCSSCWIILVKAICLATRAADMAQFVQFSSVCASFIEGHLGILYHFVGDHLSMGLPELLTPKMARRKKRASSNHPFGVVIFLDSLRKIHCHHRGRVDN